MQDQYLRRKIIFLAAFVSLSASLQIFNDAFIYWQESLLGEFWRLWTAHWVHVGWAHYFLNILAFICLPFIFPVHLCGISSQFFWFCHRWSAWVLFFLPNIEAYAGLSGVLHGAYVAVACVHLLYQRERGFAVLVLFLIFAKLIWENTIGIRRLHNLLAVRYWSKRIC